LYVNDVSKLSVNDTFQLLDLKGNPSGSVRTVTAIDTSTNSITVSPSISGVVNGQLLIETTASSSSPIIRYIDTTGITKSFGSSVTASGMGTRELTITINDTASTSVEWGKPIIVEYAV